MASWSPSLGVPNAARARRFQAACGASERSAGTFNSASLASCRQRCRASPPPSPTAPNSRNTRSTTAILRLACHSASRQSLARRDAARDAASRHGASRHDASRDGNSSDGTSRRGVFGCNAARRLAARSCGMHASRRFLWRPAPNDRLLAATGKAVAAFTSTAPPGVHLDRFDASRACAVASAARSQTEKAACFGPHRLSLRIGCAGCAGSLRFPADDLVDVLIAATRQIDQDRLVGGHATRDVLGGGDRMAALQRRHDALGL